MGAVMVTGRLYTVEVTQAGIDGKGERTVRRESSDAKECQTDSKCSVAPVGLELGPNWRDIESTVEQSSIGCHSNRLIR